jgi:hypothetical protein
MGADAFIDKKIIELNECISLFTIVPYHKRFELNKSLRGNLFVCDAF